MTASQYDMIADRYDSLFSDPASLKENRELSCRLAGISGSVFEIGCGTGLLVDLMRISPDNYLGVDPSQGMVDFFIGRHPEFSERIIVEPFSESSCILPFDNIVSIFGSISYVEPVLLDFINSIDKHLFLMFYKPGYYPVTYTRTGIEFSHYTYTKDELLDIFNLSDVSDFGNYYIVER